jgi:prophage regulatory protein
MSTPKQSRLITYAELHPLKGVGYSRMQLSRLAAKREFPQSVRVSNSRVAWLESEIDEWIASRERGKADQPKKKAAGQ